MKDEKNKQAQTKSTTRRPNVGRAKARRKGRWWLLLLIVVALGASGYVAARMLRETGTVKTQGGTFTARKADLTVTVSVAGSIRAHKSIQYKCQVERRGGSEITILSIVPAGTYITQEDVNNEMVLVKLDSSALEDQLVQEQMQLASDRESATAAKESYDIQVIQNESDISAGKLEVRFALMDLQKTLGATLAADLVRDVNEAVNLTDHVAPFLGQVRTDPNLLDGSGAGQELKRLKDQIVLAQGDLKTAEATLAGTKRLHDANYVSDLDLERDKLRVVNCRFDEQDARVNLDLFLRYDLPKNTEQGVSDYIEAGRKLERIYAQARSMLAQEQAKLSNAEQRFKQQTERVDELEQQIKYCTIQAKAPGLVIYGSGDSHDSFRAFRGGSGGIIEEGEAVYEGQTLISSPDTADMVAEISVHETEVDKVRPGQPAEIVMDAFPDRVLQGEVIEVAPLPDQRRGFLNPDLKVYQTLVRIDGTHEFLKTRMSCNVQILVQNLKDVLQVPIQVVANRRGRKVCYVVTAQGHEEREVQTGAFNDTFVEIVSGLEADEVVLLNPPLFTEVGASAPTGPGRERFGGRTVPEPEQQAPAPNREGQTESRPGPGGPAGPSASRPPGGSESELSDEMIDRILAGLKQADPAKAEELEKLRKSDPEQFKIKLRETMESMRTRMMRQGGGPGQRPGGPSGRQGPGGGRQGPGSRQDGPGGRRPERTGAPGGGPGPGQ